MTNPLDLIVCPVGALDAAERAAITALCGAAFGRDFSSLFDLVPPTTHHVRAFLRGQPVGHACWSPRTLEPGNGTPTRTAYVDAVATDPAWQRRRIGSRVLERLADETGDYQLRALSTGRVSFYERLGWRRWRGRVAVRLEGALIDTPDDTILILPTTKTPPLDLDGTLIGDPRPGQYW